MIKVSVFYPNQAGSTFDMRYYQEKHIPMVRRLLGDSCTGAEVELGLAGGSPGTGPTYIAMGHLFFKEVNDFLAGFAAHGAEITGDIPNYTNAAPIVQISEVRM